MTVIYTVAMPDIGEGVVEGEVISWLKAIDENVGQDEPVVVLMTDKATVELPAPHPGKISRQYYKVGEIAQKDKPLYDIEITGAVASPQKVVEEKPKEKKVEKSTPSQVSSSHAVLALPSVRKLAQDMGIDIEAVSGTGKEGRVTVEDLQQYIAQRKKPEWQNKCPQSAEIIRQDQEETVQIAGIRGLMARKMQESHENIPQFSFFEQADATRLIQLRKKINEAAVQEGMKITYMPFILRALSLTISQFPELNSSFDAKNRQLIIHKPHNIGIAVSSPQGLIVPVIKNVEDMSFEQLVKAYQHLKSQAEAGALQSGDMKEGTITISNFGGLAGGGLWATPIINYPEVAILAIGRIQKQPVVREGELAVRDMVNLSWSFDHRIIDGDAASRYSHHFVKLINNPAELLHT